MRNPFELAEMKNYLHVLAIICLSRSPRPPALVIAINARTFELKTWQQLLSNGHPPKNTEKYWEGTTVFRDSTRGSGNLSRAAQLPSSGKGF